MSVVKDAIEVRRRKNAEQALRYYYRNRKKVLERQKRRRDGNKKPLAMKRFAVGSLTYGTLSGKHGDREERIRRLMAICIAMGTVKP